MLKLESGGILRRSENTAVAAGGRIKRLAQSIEELAEKDERLLRRTREMDVVRRTAAVEIYTICRDFVQTLNRFMTKGALLLDPEQFSDSAFQEDGANLIQISVRGRILQVSYCATPGLVSTEDFRVPYTLAGFVRAFNQELLEKEAIEEQLLFFTVEAQRKTWRYFDPRTYRSGTFDQEYLVSVMERLI